MLRKFRYLVKGLHRNLQEVNFARDKRQEFTGAAPHPPLGEVSLHPIFFKIKKTSQSGWDGAAGNERTQRSTGLGKAGC